MAYTRLGDRDKLQLVAPLDYIILGALKEDEGALFGGVYPVGDSAAEIAAQALQGMLDGNEASQRLRVMSHQKLVVGVKGRRTSSLIWQITAKGKQALQEWKSTQGTENPNGSV